MAPALHAYTRFIMFAMHRWISVPIILAAWTGSAFAQDRIVEGRPALYSFKRAIHPLTWLEVAPKPLLRSAENGRLSELVKRKPEDKDSGVSFGFGGTGPGSGFGPRVTFFD